jgi:hypothetical protein
MEEELKIIWYGIILVMIFQAIQNDIEDWLEQDQQDYKRQKLDK